MAYNKSEICRTANHLVSTGLSRRDAFPIGGGNTPVDTAQRKTTSAQP